MAEIDRFELTATDWAYLGGVFDTKGSFRIYKHCPTTHPRHFYTTISFTNTNQLIPAYLEEVFGGIVYITRINTVGHSDTFQWLLKSENRGSFLTSILPYSILKRGQIELVLNFDRHRKQVYEGLYTKEGVDLQAYLVLETSKLDWFYQQSCFLRDKKPEHPPEDHVLQKNTECARSYLSGLLDGGGYFNIGKSSGKSKSLRYSGRVNFYNTSPFMCSLLVDLYGGTVCIRPPSKGKPNPLYKWYLHGKECVVLLQELLSLIRMKQKQAALLLEFLRYQRQEHTKLYSKGRLGSASYPEEVIAKFEGYYQDLRKLNQGPRPYQKEGRIDER